MRNLAHFFTSVVAALVVATTFGCKDTAPPEADIPPSVRRELEAAALAVLASKEDWSARAEFRIRKDGDDWLVTAWRVENPSAKGDSRYVPWGARTMVLDRNYRVTSYRSGPK